MSYTVSKSLLKKNLQLLVNQGDDSQTTKTYTNVNPEATKDQIMAAADALSALMVNTVVSVYDVEKNLLSKVETQA